MLTTQNIRFPNRVFPLFENWCSIKRLSLNVSTIFFMMWCTATHIHL